MLDIGCGANLIYPLLGAAMHGWRFVGVDITDTAIEWARKNAAANPQLAHLLEIRRVPSQGLEAGVPASCSRVSASLSRKPALRSFGLAGCGGEMLMHPISCTCL